MLVRWGSFLFSFIHSGFNLFPWWKKTVMDHQQRMYISIHLANVSVYIKTCFFFRLHLENKVWFMHDVEQNRTEQKLRASEVQKYRHLHDEINVVTVNERFLEWNHGHTRQRRGMDENMLCKQLLLYYSSFVELHLQHSGPCILGTVQTVKSIKVARDLFALILHVSFSCGKHNSA